MLIRRSRPYQPTWAGTISYCRSGRSIGSSGTSRRGNLCIPNSIRTRLGEITVSGTIVRVDSSGRQPSLTSPLVNYALNGLQRCWLPEHGRWSHIYHLDGRDQPNESLAHSDVFYTLNVLLGFSRLNAGSSQTSTYRQLSSAMLCNC